MLVTLDDGTVQKLEKNETVQEYNATAADRANQTFDIPLNGRDLTVKGMITQASAGHESDFYRYRAGSNNCHEFVADMITRNGLLPDDHEQLRLQKADALINPLPGGAYVPNTITDAAAVGRRILAGDGLIKRRKHKARSV